MVISSLRKHTFRSTFIFVHPDIYFDKARQGQELQRYRRKQVQLPIHRRACRIDVHSAKPKASINTDTESPP